MENSLSLFAQASEAAGRGDRLTARCLLYELIYFEPCNHQAWLLLSQVVEDPLEVEVCLRKAQPIGEDNPAGECLESGLGE
jgi:hypothetical protein